MYQRKILDPKSTNPFYISRSKLDIFINCPRCFYLDLRLGIGQPRGFPFNLNSAVDRLLKKEFDIYREKKQPHPLMEKYKIEAIPYSHPDLDKWRENFKGIRVIHKESNFELGGAIDDVWVNPNGELYIVDYKATSKDEAPTLDSPWQIAYKNQMEIYQWLFKNAGFKVSNTTYFVYANGDRNKETFDDRLIFDTSVIKYEGNCEWVSNKLIEARSCVMAEKIPNVGKECPFCSYRENAGRAFQKHMKK